MVRHRCRVGGGVAVALIVQISDEVDPGAPEGVVDEVDRAADGGDVGVFVRVAQRLDERADRSHREPADARPPGRSGREEVLDEWADLGLQDGLGRNGPGAEMAAGLGWWA